MQEYQLTFIDLALGRNALRFGSFTLKSGRESPYFFNAGLFDDGEALAVLGQCYAAALQRSGIEYDMLFGPAYKGIPLVASTAVALAEHHRRTVPWAFNRKEAKDHGEGGSLVGTPLTGQVLILDDVITAGTSVRESVEIIRAAGATPCGVLIALDRQEQGQGERSAVAEVAELFQTPVYSIITLAHIIDYLEREGAQTELAAIRRYRADAGAP